MAMNATKNAPQQARSQKEKESFSPVFTGAMDVENESTSMKSSDSGMPISGLIVFILFVLGVVAQAVPAARFTDFHQPSLPDSVVILPPIR